jgi:hypothetical protein
MVKIDKTDENTAVSLWCLYVPRMFSVSTCCLVSVPLYMYIHPPLMWGQCGDDVVQLQCDYCSLVEGLVDLFRMKTCTLACVSWVLDELMYATCFQACYIIPTQRWENEIKYQRSKYKRICSRKKTQGLPHYTPFEGQAIALYEIKPITRRIKKAFLSAYLYHNRGSGRSVSIQ